MRVHGLKAIFSAVMVLCGACVGRRPSIYPNPGFGRVGCFAGPSLAFLGPDSGGSAGSKTLARGPWLVLDSLDATELIRFPEEGARTGAHVLRAEKLIRHPAQWERVDHDSIRVQTVALHASTTWNLRLFADSVIGTGTLPHDVFTKVDGERVQYVSRWQARAWRVPCASVPIR